MNYLSNLFSKLLNPTGGFYLYGYPIVGSIIAGFIFWIIFSYLPEKSRKKSFGLGVLNDLLTLNGQIFSYFDYLLRHRERSPSFFQDKIHACSLTKEDISLALHNKIISPDHLNDPLLASQMLVVKEDLIKKVAEMDIIINRLYSFNYFLRSEEVALLRSIYGNIHCYLPYIELNIDEDGLFPMNPSVSFMTSSLIELQDDFRSLRKLIFQKRLLDRNFLIGKILRSFNTGNYKNCIKECKLGSKKFPSDSSLYNLFLVRCYYLVNKKKIAYQLLSDYLLVNNDLTSNRNNLYPLLQEPMIEDLIINRTNREALNNMKQIVRGEKLDFENFLSSNEKLKKYFAEKTAISLA
jgi:hypothetical protein